MRPRPGNRGFDDGGTGDRGPRPVSGRASAARRGGPGAFLHHIHYCRERFHRLLGEWRSGDQRRTERPPRHRHRSRRQRLLLRPLNHVVQKIDTNGIITTIAGTGVAGYNGDNIPGTQAQLNTTLARHHRPRRQSLHRRLDQRPHSQARAQRHHLHHRGHRPCPAIPATAAQPPAPP